MIPAAEMKKIVLRLSCLLLFLMATMNRCAVEGFYAPTTALRSKATVLISMAATWSSDNNNHQSSDGGPQNATTTAARPASPIKKTVFTNEHYTPPVIATPSRIISSRSAAERKSLNQSDKKSWQGGQYIQDIGQSLCNAGAGAKKYASTRMDNTGINEAKLFLQEAGHTMQEMGAAWQENDWERVTYAALDASQTMELVAQSLNNIKLYTSGRKSNDLQQAFAGVGVELKCLSKKKQPEALTLQGFSLRLYQASRSFSSLADENGSKKAIRELEKASQAAQKLAKLYGATSFYLPRRWRLWWHSNVSSKDKGDLDIANEEESEWQ